MNRFALALVAGMFALPSSLSAQAAQPGIVVVSQQKCDSGTLEEFHDYFRSTMAPVLDEMVAEGKLTGWGVMDHMWGDEWNHVIYYTARDVPTFHNSFMEAFGRISQRDPNVVQRIAQYCSEHKDSIYNLVMSSAMPQR